ncbi:MAG: hypothetical protein ABFS86_08655 [Planctomycetota bacterium]
MSSPRQYQQAFRSLNAFYKRLVDDLADKVVERESSFEETYLGLGEEVIERYGHLLLLSQHCLMGLQQAMGGEGPPPPVGKLASISCPEADVDEQLAEWLAENEGVEVVGFQVLPGRPTDENPDPHCRCLVVYNTQL